MNLAELWIQAKEAERIAIETRRDLEDKMSALFGIAETDEGTQNYERDGYKIKIVSRLNRKVDSDMVQEIAAEIGVTDKLGDLYRWKAEVNANEMKKMPDEIRVALAKAVTVTPGRPSYSIEPKGE